MGFDKGRVLLVMFIALNLFFITGCAIVSQGRIHKITQQQVNRIKVGETTKEDIIDMFGKPQRIVRKPNNVEVYVYTHGVERSIGIPFFISIGRAAGSGQTLTVSFSQYGDVIDYEYALDQRAITK